MVLHAPPCQLDLKAGILRSRANTFIRARLRPRTPSSWSNVHLVTAPQLHKSDGDVTNMMAGFPNPAITAVILWSMGSVARVFPVRSISSAQRFYHLIFYRRFGHQLCASGLGTNIAEKQVVPCLMRAAGQIEPARSAALMFPVPIPQTGRHAQRQAPEGP